MSAEHRHQDDLEAAESSPVFRGVWEPEVPVSLFESADPPRPENVQRVMDRVLSTVRSHVESHSVYGADGIVSNQVITELAEAGYWGLRIDPAYGGAGATFPDYARFLIDVLTIDPWVAVLGSAQAGLGPVTTLNRFANEEQKRRLLPVMARGDRLGAYATTEPTTSSDLKAIRTEAVSSSNGDLLVTGEKYLITNASPGRLLSVLCRVDGQLRMLLIELPDVEDDRFSTIDRGVRAFRHLHNRSVLFDRLPVPPDNLIEGDGRRVAYHALNHGRVMLCAGSAGMLRRMVTSLVPWVQSRETFGAPIGSRALVRHRLARLAARLVGCDAVLAWSSQLLEAGYRGELEGIIAKVFSTEMVKEATVDVLLKTHGGRALTAGNLFADDVYELLAPAVYEGENEILTLGMFTGLTRTHDRDVLRPLSRTLTGDGSPSERMRRAWAGRSPLASYGSWVARRQVTRVGVGAVRSVPTDLDGLSSLACHLLQTSGLEMDAALRHYGAAVADRQATTFELARRAQLAAAMLVVSRYGARQPDPLARDAAACMGAELGMRLTGTRPSSGFNQLAEHVGRDVAGGGFAPQTAAEAPKGGSSTALLR